MKHKPRRLPHKIRAALIVYALGAVIALALLVGALGPQASHPAVFVPEGLDPAYCARIGDDNCDGMLVPAEPGWRCVPPAGGPLAC